jgi:hypothetical protein
MRGQWRRLLTRQWMTTHALVWFAVALFLTLGWWQAIRAGQGNARSIGYALEWPTFAIIVLFLWVRAMRDELRNPASAAAAEGPQPVSDRPVIDDSDDPELAAYNRHLADLHNKHLQSRR